MRGPGVNIPKLKEPKIQERTLNQNIAKGTAQVRNQDPINEIKEVSNRRVPP